MIKIHLLHDRSLGAEVRYVPMHAIIDGVIDYNLCEFGRITSWNRANIFVDYGNNCGRGVATNPGDLEFINSILCKEHGAVLKAQVKETDKTQAALGDIAKTICESMGANPEDTEFRINTRVEDE